MPRGRGVQGPTTYIKASTPGGTTYWYAQGREHEGFTADPAQVAAIAGTGYPIWYIDYVYGDTTPRSYVTQQTQSGQQARELTATALEGPVAVQYGQGRIGGSVFYASSVGNALTMAFGLSNGPNHSLVKAEIGEHEIFSAGGGHFGLGALFNFYPGLQSPPAADPLLLAATGASGSTFERYPLLSYAVGQFYYNSETWGTTSGWPEPKWTIKGRLVYDPRTGLTVWSDNPALCLLDYLTNDVYGVGFPLAAIDLASVSEAANYCDVLVADEKRHRLNLTVMREAAQSVWVDTIRAHFRCRLLDRGGIMVFVVDKVRATDHYLTDANTTPGDLEQVGGDSIPNRVTVGFVDPGKDYNTVPAVAETGALQAGLEIAVPADYVLEGCSTASEAARQAWYLLNKLQANLRVSLAVNALTGITIEPGDVCDYTSARLGLTNQLLRVLRVSGSTVTTEFLLDCEPYNPGLYSDATVPVETKPTTTLASPLATPTPPTGLTLTEEMYYPQNEWPRSRIKIEWTPSTWAYYGGTRIRVLRSGGVPYDLGVFRSGPAYIESSDDLALYFVSADTVSSAAPGLYSTPAIATLQAQNKQDPPTDVPNVFAAIEETGVRLFWQPANDVDLVGYEVRYISADQAGPLDWEHARIVQTPIAALTITHNPPFGNWIYFVKAIDSGRRYSANPAVIAVAFLSKTIEAGADVDGEYIFGLLDYEERYGSPAGLRYRAGGNLVIENLGNTSGLTQIVYLTGGALEMTADEIDAECLAAGYTSFEEWEENSEYYLNGAPPWAPLFDSTVETSSVGYTMPISSNFGPGLRLREWRMHLPNTLLVGPYIGRPNVQAFAELYTNFYNQDTSLPWNGTLPAHIQIGPVVKSPRTGFSDGKGILLSTNSPWDQEVIEQTDVFFDEDGRAAIGGTWRVEQRDEPVLRGTAVSNGAGVVSVVFPTALPAGVVPIVKISSATAVYTSSATNTGFTATLYHPVTGAVMPALNVYYTVIDTGFGGLINTWDMH